MAGDVTWYDWSEYPGPYVHPSPASDSAIGRTLLYPETEPAGFEDVLVPRLGLELDWEQTWKGRVGYGYRRSPAPTPDGLGNVIDGDTHTLGAGLGFRTTVGPDDYVVQADVAVSVGLMPEQRVDKGGTQESWDVYDFGGKTVDASLTLTAGYAP